jgi:hypothetical protein
MRQFTSRKQILSIRLWKEGIILRCWRSIVIFTPVYDGPASADTDGDFADSPARTVNSVKREDVMRNILPFHALRFTSSSDAPEQVFEIVENRTQITLLPADFRILS